MITSTLIGNAPASFKAFFDAFDCLTITGPTGVGKTGLALRLASVWPIEIISMDSALVYTGMDIGTAKPSPAERRLVPHHLIDIRTPHQAYNAAEFSADARSLITDIRARGKLPVLVGGTLLYFKALFEGLNDLPPTQPTVRAEINAQAALVGWHEMHKLLGEIDPIAAQRLPPNDVQRVSRALEVWRISGKPMSSYFQDLPLVELRNKLISLEPSNRSWLHKRLEERFDLMIQQGFIDEVRELRKDSRLSADLPSMRCVGYRQIWQALEQSDSLNHSHSHSLRGPQLSSLIEKGSAATRQLAKRQLTWLRSMPHRLTLECDKEDGQALMTDLFSILKI